MARTKADRYAAACALRDSHAGFCPRCQYTLQHDSNALLTDTCWTYADLCTIARRLRPR